MEKNVEDQLAFEEVHGRVNKQANIKLYLAKETSMDWICFEMIEKVLLHEITKGRMRGKPTRGRRLQMLYYLTNDDGYAAFKRAAEDTAGWRHTKTFSLAEVF